MNERLLTAMRDLVQEDVGGRGLRTDPEMNLINAYPGDFAAACKDVADSSPCGLLVVTGFYIAHAEPPCAETDGPLGALFLARALTPLGITVRLATDGYCVRPLQEGLAACGLGDRVAVLELPPKTAVEDYGDEFLWNALEPLGTGADFPLTHLVALERVGPNHTPSSLRHQKEITTVDRHHFQQEVPARHQNRCHSMRGRDITAETRPAHLLFEAARFWKPRVYTIGIGDGGNEIGMGKVPWDTIRRNIPNGGRIACRVPTDHLLVAGVSNWGAYALAAGVRLLRGAPHDPALFDVGRERELLQIMVERGPLVDGKTGRPEATVDGLPFDRYAEVLKRLDAILSRAGNERPCELTVSR
jgi:hypothetical protein